MTLDEIERLCRAEGLTAFGAFHPAAQDMPPPGVGTLVLLGPHEPGFWPLFTDAPEYQDGAPHPMDRWSTRVVGKLAEQMGAVAFFPFGGPPFQPFIRWALASGRAFQSPLGLLVHDTAGMMISYRGALGFAEKIAVPAPADSPCLTCATQPCRTACPADAFAQGTYDVAACKADLDRVGNDCMIQGCAVRRACPVSGRYGRLAAQSAFHMEAFK